MRLICLAIAIIGCDCACALAAPARPHNFIVILADDLGAKELGCYGSTRHQTPRIDRLAAEGIRFETCWATPLCTPSRVMLMTGQYAFRTGYYNLIGRPYTPRPGSPQYDVGEKLTFADVLKSKGYATAIAGKWQLTGKVPSLVHDCGFDEYLMWAYKENLPPGVEHTGRWEGRNAAGRTARYWHPCLLRNGQYVPTGAEDYGPDLFTDFLLDFVRRNKAKPFLAYYPMAHTHAPHEPTPDPKQPGRRNPAGFKSNVEYMDHLVGRIVDEVDRLGLAEETVILFTADNGTGGDGKGTTTELGVRVPLVVRCPGTVKAGVVSRELASLVDVLPTMIELSGAAAPAGHVLDGRSLLPTLRGEPMEHRPWLFSYFKNERMLRDKRWLLEGDGKFFDCGDSRDGSGYRDVTGSTAPEVAAARERFAQVLRDLPAPPAEPQGDRPGRARRRAQGASIGVE
jgi:arylsulfatase A